jgi:hypothetical protein
MKLTHLFLGIALCLALSCTSYMKVWAGKTKQEVVAKMGPPLRTASDEKEGEILIYERNETRDVSVLRNNRYVLEPKLHLVKTMFYLDKAGKVYNIVADAQPIQ